MRVERMRIKRRLALTLAAAMLLLAGCGDSERVIGGDVVNVTTGGSQSGESREGQESPQADPAPEEIFKGYVFKVGDVTVEVDGDAAPVIEALGEPASYFEAASCAFEGLDKTYTYDAVEIVTYPDGDVDRISTVRILTDAVSTPEGVTIGSTPEDVTAAYGEEYDTIGQQYAYEDGDCLLSVLFQDGKAISVEYTALNDMLG